MYEGDTEDISEKARELEKERDLLGRRADRFDGGEALLEIGLVICSITLLTRRRAFWFCGMLIRLCGCALALSGFLPPLSRLNSCGVLRSPQATNFVAH